MIESSDLLRIGDIASLHSEVKNNQFIISSKSYIPSTATLTSLNNIQEYESLFRIERPRLSNLEEYINPDDQSKQEGDLTGKHQVVNFDQSIIFIHYLSGRYLLAKQSDGQHINLIVSEQYLKSCQFKLMPMFRCQSLGSKKVRHGQQIILRSVVFQDNQGNYNLGFSSSNNFSHTTIKADIFSIKINKRGTLQNNNNIYFRKLYKINNIQIDRKLLLSNKVITFFQPPNELQTMFYFLNSQNLTTMTPIKQQNIIYLKHIRSQFFIELHAGQFKSTDKLSKSCQFRLVEYRNTNAHILTKQAVLVLLHVQSNRYLSFQFQHNKGDFISKSNSKFDLKDTFQLVPVSDNSIRQCFFINQFKSFLEKFLLVDFEKQTILNELYQLKNVLYEMLIFIFDETKVACQLMFKKFFELQAIKTCTSENHVLFKQWNIGPPICKLIILLAKDYRRLVVQIKNVSDSKKSKKALQKDDLLERMEIDAELMRIFNLLTVGMCKGNQKNVKLFLKFSSCIFENIDLDFGAIQMIIHTFKNNKDFLRLLQGTPQAAGHKSYLHQLISQVKKIPKTKIGIAIKLAELFKCLIVVNNSDPVKMNQTILGEQFSKNVLEENVFTKLFVQDGELQVTLFEDQSQVQQIIQMYSKKNKYSHQLVLVQKLLLLYAELCAQRNNLQYFREKIPLKIVIKYINNYAIDGSLKNCFLKILLNTYLNSLPRRLYLQNNIISLEHGNNIDIYQQPSDITDRLLNKDNNSNQYQLKQYMFSSYSSELNEIKDQLLKQILKQISIKRFNESSHMILQILYNYLTFNMLNFQDRLDFRKAIVEFLCSNSQLNPEYRQKVFLLAVKVLHKFQEYSEQQNCKSVVLQLLNYPRKASDINNLIELTINKNKKYDQNTNQLIQILFTSCQQFKNSSNTDFIDLSLDFIKKKMLPKQSLTRNLKSIVLIEDQEMIQLYKRLKDQTILDIEHQIEKLSLSFLRNDKTLMYQAVRKLNQAFEDVNIRFTSGQASNKRYQHMLKQLGVHNIVLSFLIQSFNDLKSDILADTAKVYKSAFKFLTSFIENNKTTLKIIVRSVNQLKKYIVFPEMGQSHFFLMLTKIQDVKFAIEENIVPIVLESLPNNIYLMCIILQYCKKQNIMNVKFIDKLTKKFLTDESMFAKILMMKKNRGLGDFALNQRNIMELTYYSQLFKLLNILYEHGTDKKYFIQMSKRYITLETALNVLNQNDIYEERNESNFVYTFVQKQFIKCIKFLKLDEVSFNKDNYPSLESFFQKSLNKVHFYNQKVQSEIDNYLNTFMENQYTQTYNIFLLTENFKANQLSFQRNLNFVFYLTSLLAPLIGGMLGRCLENQNGQLTQLSKKQIQLLQDSFCKKIKQVAYQFLDKYDYDKAPIEYSKAIGQCQQIFNIKIKLGFAKSKQRVDQAMIVQQITEQIIQDSRLELVLHFHILGQSQKQSKLYKAIFDTLHNETLKIILKQERQNFSKSIIELVKQQNGMIDLLSEMYIRVLQKGDFNKLSFRKQLKTIIISKTQQVQLRFINNKIAESTIKWCSQLGCDPSIHSKVIILLSNLMLFNDKENPECQNKVLIIFKSMETNSQFFEKFKYLIKDEKLVYTNLIFNQKRRSSIISQHDLCYQTRQQNSHSFSLVLIFLMALIQGSNKQNKQFVGNQLGFFQNLIQLLKVFIKFSMSFGNNYKIYYCLSLHQRISTLLQTIIHFINYQSTVNIQISVDKNIMLTLMDILALNDQLKHQQQTHSKSAFDILQQTMLDCPHQNQKKYLKYIYSVSKASVRQYKDLPGFKNPFLPTQPNYLRIKTAAIKIISQFTHLENKQQQKLMFKSLSQSIIKTNIINIHSKHLIVYGKTYEVFAFYNKSRVYNNPSVGRIGFKELIEESNFLENGFMLVYILRKTESHKEQIDKQVEVLKKKKVSGKPLLGPITQVIDFFRDCSHLIKGCFRSCLTIKAQINQSNQNISNSIKFFLENSGRIQLIKDQILYAIDYPILPECVRKIELQRQYLDQIDLSSIQSKSQSILKYSSKFILLYDNEQTYKVKYKSLPFIDLLLQHINLFKNFSFLIIILLNVLILIDHTNAAIYNGSYTKQSQIFYIFIILQMCISYVLLTLFLLKQSPLMILQINNAIQIRRNTYGSNYNTYPKIWQFLIKVSMFFSNTHFMYHMLFAIAVTVSFFVPVFVAILLLDIFIRIPLLRRILMAIWRPKIQIILALIAFILIQYYFSILLYFAFQKQTFGYCNNLPDCFSFVYFVTYKVVGGFPGYLFEFKQSEQAQFQVNWFSIFENIYIIITFEIFFAVIIGIIIDNFTILRTQEDERRNHLENYCLICGVNKAVINESGTKTNFKKHIRQDHNIWNYFYFFTYIQKKSSNQRTQLQQYIWKALQNKSTEWLPLNYMTRLHAKF